VILSDIYRSTSFDLLDPASDEKREGHGGEPYNGIEIKKYFLQRAFYSEVNNCLKYNLSTSAFSPAACSCRLSSGIRDPGLKLRAEL